MLFYKLAHRVPRPAQSPELRPWDRTRVTLQARATIALGVVQRDYFELAILGWLVADAGLMLNLGSPPARPSGIQVEQQRQLEEMQSSDRSSRHQTSSKDSQRHR